MNNNQQQLTLIADSQDETISIGNSLGSNLKGGEVIELLSDLGGGKTTITKGIARGAGSDDLVSSPSFTICNEYQAKNFRIYHFDFYRLNEPGIIKQELEEVLNEPTNVILIEWPGTVENILPSDKITIKLTATNETKRQITIGYDQTLSYITKNLS